MQKNDLPNSGMEVSAFSLGSYETLARMEYRDIVELISTALEAGITLFDVAHYRRAPHTEVILARALEDAGAPDTIRVMTKVWKESADADVGKELQESLFRLRRDVIDIVLLYGPRWGIDQPIEHAEDVLGLVESGLARSWGGINWRPEHIGEVVDTFRSSERALPVLMQLKYNPARRAVAESEAYLDVFRTSGMRLQSSDALEGGVFAGKSIESPTEGGRVLGRDPGRIREQIAEAMPRFRTVADGFGVTPAQLSLAFSLAFEHTATVLFGASSVEQLRDNLGALALAKQHGAEVRRLVGEAVNIDGHRLDVPPGSIVLPHEDPYAVR